jgi:hypothetical protein
MHIAYEVRILPTRELGRPLKFTSIINLDPSLSLNSEPRKICQRLKYCTGKNSSAVAFAQQTGKDKDKRDMFILYWNRIQGHSAKCLAPDCLVLKLCRTNVKKPGYKTFHGMLDAGNEISSECTVFQ